MTTSLPLKTAHLANAWLRAGCQQLETLFAERERLLDVVLSIRNPDPDDAAVLQITGCETRTLKAAHDVLDAPVHGLGDLYAKYSAVLRYEEYYLERPALLKPLLQQVCDDIKSILDHPIQDEAFQVAVEGPTDVEGASPATATDPSQVPN